MFDLHHPFYRPLWIRVLIVAFCLGWAALEFAAGAPSWGVLFGGIGLWAGWRFFLAAPPAEKPQTEEERE